jgi:branched-chain amino acid aminotransferase
LNTITILELRELVAGARGNLDVRVVSTAARSLAEAASEEPDNGVYLVARTWQGGRVLELDAHFDRLERSAATLGYPLVLPRRAIRELIAENLPRHEGVELDGRFRVTAVLEETPRFLVSIEAAHALPADLRLYGVDCEVLPGTARGNAEVKSTAWMHQRQALGKGSGKGSGPTGGEPYEYLLADEKGHILEGATSNFYAVVRGELLTAAEGVLPGIVRRIVLEVAPAIISVRLVPLSIAQLTDVQEAFITSATRGVVPVRRIDDVLPGAPGPVTRKITEAYDAWLASHLEPLM